MQSKDQLQVFHEFSRDVAELLSSNEFVPEAGFVVSLLLVVLPVDEEDVTTGPPIAGSINFEKKTGEWEVHEEIQIPERIGATDG